MVRVREEGGGGEGGDGEEDEDDARAARPAYFIYDRAADGASTRLATSS
jgi:hypothetical protein